MQASVHRLAIVSSLSGLGILFAAGVATAEQGAGVPQTAPTREQLNPSEQTAAAKSHRTVEVAPETGADGCGADADQTKTFRLDGVDVSGARVEPVWNDFVGKDVNFHNLCEIRKRIEARLFQRGDVLARVVIPAQSLAVGQARRVKFVVIEGRVAAVRFHGDIGPVQAKVEAILNHLLGLTPFNRFTAERYLLLANDVPGVQATAKLSRSPDGGPGDFDIDITLHRFALDEVAQVQNTNSKTLGPWSAIGRVDFNSFTPLGEKTSLIAYSTLGNFSQEVVQIMEEAKIGNSGLFVQGSFAYGHSKPGDVLAPLHLSGDSYVGTMEIDDPIIRTRQLNLTLSGGLDIVNQRTDYTAGQALSDDALRVFWLKATGDAAHDFSRPILGAKTSLGIFGDLEVRKGFHILGASPNGAIALSRPQGQSDAWVVRTDSGASIQGKSLGKSLGWSLSTHLQAQWADRPLLAYEQQSIGNLTIGRGYDPAAATGDRVIADEVKLEVGPIKVGNGVGFAPYGFYDIAYVNNLSIGVQDVTLHAVGGGVEFMLPYNVRADVYYAEPLDKPFPSALRKPPGRVMVQLTVTHF